MTIWFNQSTIGSTSDVFCFKESGKEIDTVLSFTSPLVKIVKDDRYFHLVTYSAIKVTGYKIFADKKANEPKSYQDKPVIVSLMHVDKISSTYRGETKEVLQPLSHKLITGYLATLDLEKFYDVKALMLTNDEEILSHAFPDPTAMASSQANEAEVAVYRGMLCKFMPLDIESTVGAFPEAIKQVEELCKQLGVQSTKSGFGGGKSGYSESTEMKLEAKKKFFLKEISNDEGSMFAVLRARRYEPDRAIMLILRLINGN